MYKVLLYYKFIKIEDPKSLRDQQYKLCEKLGLKGRILIAKEGINGTLGGDEKSCKEYIEETSKIDGLSDIEWKISQSEIDPFPRLRVVAREEIVTLKFDVDLTKKAQYIEPKELVEMYRNNEDFVIIDGRNEYEARIGKFKNAIVPKINNFREFPSWLEKNIDNFKGKTVVTYCTGGIRCEKISALLVDKGLENVKQLHGGIHRYSDETGGENFDGTMYVFDNRVHIDVNKVNPEIVSQCEYCGKKVARYNNCANVLCNRQFICCEDCESLHNRMCTNEKST